MTNSSQINSAALDRVYGFISLSSLVDPLLYSLSMLFKFVSDEETNTMKITSDKIYINPQFILSLSDTEFEMLMRFEFYRIAFRHPFERLGTNPKYDWISSNLAIQEVLEIEDESYRGFVHNADRFFSNYYETDFWKIIEYEDLTLRHKEFYYDLLTKIEDDDDEMEMGDVDLSAVSRHFSASNYDSYSSWGECMIAVSGVVSVLQGASKSGQWGEMSVRVRDRLSNIGIIASREMNILQNFRGRITSTERVITRTKPSRRYGFGFPGHRNITTTKLAVFLDVSGSMSGEDITRGLSFIKSFFEHGVDEIELYQFDSEVLTERPITITTRTSELVLEGRGGTDFNSVFSFIDEKGLTGEYDGILIYSDGGSDEIDTKYVIEKSNTILLYPNREDWGRSHSKFENRLMVSVVSD